MTIQQAAMLSTLNIRQWSGRRFDRGASTEYTRDKQAKDDAARINKLLVPTDALKPISTAVSKARNEHYRLTLPWLDDGPRLLPVDLYDRHSDALRQCRAQFEQAVSDFVSAYPDYVRDAAIRMGELYRAEDYPSSGEIEGRFGWDVGILPVPASDDFRVNLRDGEMSRIQAQADERITQAVDAATASVRDRIQETVGRLVERLRAYKPATNGGKAEGIFRDSIVQNVADLADLLPALNINSDPDIAAAADELREIARGIDAPSLRSSAKLRQSTADEANAILSKMVGYGAPAVAAE